MGFLTVQDITNILGEINFAGNTEIKVEGLNFCDRKSEKNSILSYVMNKKYQEAVIKAEAIKILLVQPEDLSFYKESMLGRDGCLIISDNPEMDFYKVHETLCHYHNFYEPYNFISKIGRNCNIHDSAIIYDGVKIGDNVVIGANSVVKPGTIIEDNVIIGCNTTIGSEGFQIIKVNGKEPLHVTHVGKTHICENVYVGDNTCIANSLFEGETYIGKGSKIDNFVHIAHNLYVGENVVVSAHVALCGSVKIENGAWIAPNSSILNRVTVGKCATVGLGSVVTRNVKSDTVVYGVPAKSAI